MTPHRPLELLDAQRRARLHDQARLNAHALRREARARLGQQVMAALARASCTLARHANQAAARAAHPLLAGLRRPGTRPGAAARGLLEL